MTQPRFLTWRAQTFEGGPWEAVRAPYWPEEVETVRALLQAVDGAERGSRERSEALNALDLLHQLKLSFPDARMVGDDSD